MSNTEWRRKMGWMMLDLMLVVAVTVVMAARGC